MSNPASRIPLYVPIIIGALVLICLMVWSMRVERALGRFERRLDAGANNALLPAQQQQLRSLETRYARLVEASVETKLRSLEKNAERGTLAAEDLRLLQDVTGELRFLREHPDQIAAESAVAPSFEHPRFSPLAAPEPAVDGSELLRQIDQLRSYFYVLSLGLGIMAIIAGGFWFGYRRRGRLIASSGQRQLPLIRALEHHKRRR
jgi:HAMP domain-containing protein